jgi:uncharacterized protein (TIGR03083 family)
VVTGDDVRAAAESVVALLTPVIDTADWEQPAGSLEWTCHVTLAHLVDCLYWYASNLVRAASQPTRAESPDIDRGMPVGELVDALTSAGALLGRVVDTTEPDARGYHVAGNADASGFAGMGCDEILVHGYDIALGLGLAYSPPIDVAERTLRRLFPWTAEAGDGWAGLLWANGREPLGDVAPPGSEWMWWCAPLNEWDGTTIPRWAG